MNIANLTLATSDHSGVLPFSDECHQDFDLCFEGSDGSMQAKVGPIYLLLAHAGKLKWVVNILL